MLRKPAIALLFCLGGLSAFAEVFSGSGNLVIPRSGHRAVVLGDGRIFMLGGVQPPASAEVYDPRSGTSRLVPQTFEGVGSCAALLPDGNVLVVTSTPRAGFIYLFNPDTFETTEGRLSGVPREGCTATPLARGDVLITGGTFQESGGFSWPRVLRTFIATAEVFDGATGGILQTGSMTTPRNHHRSTLLADGRVLITGGLSSPQYIGPPESLPAPRAVAEAEIFDPAAGIFTPLGPMTTRRAGHTSMLLPDGRVLLAGGDALGTAEVFDPATRTFRRIGFLSTTRTDHQATLLPGGLVLITGGAPRGTTDFFDPRRNAFTAGPPMTVGRLGHTASLLPSGAVEVAGGTSTEGVESSVERLTSERPRPLRRR
jgi:hypothetical protein